MGWSGWAPAQGAGSGGASDFLTLSDTPASYVGQGLLHVRVNLAETGLEFIGAGDVSTTSIFELIDTDDDSTTEVWGVEHNSPTAGVGPRLLTMSESGQLLVGVVGVGGGTLSVPAAGLNTEKFGSGASVGGTRGTAVGHSASITGDNGVAVGQAADCYANQGTAVGHLAVANTKGTALGATSAASGVQSVSLGALSDATGQDSIACGESAQATAVSAIAIGPDTACSANYGIALGGAATSSAIGAIAIGRNSVADAADCVVIGESATNNGASDCTILGDGASVAANTNEQSVVVGSGASSAAARGISVGYLSSVTTADGIAIGAQAVCDQTQSTVLGRSSVVGGQESTVLGNNASTTALRGTAVGQATSAGNAGTALGWSSQCLGTSSVALGERSTASASNSVAIGSLSVAAHSESLCLGSSSTSTKSNQMVVGADAREISEVVIGEGVTNAAPMAQLLVTTTNGVGTDIHATDLVLQSGLSTGEAVVTDIVFKTPDVLVGSSATLQTAVTRLTLNEAGATFNGDCSIQPDGDIFAQQDMVANRNFAFDDVAVFWSYGSGTPEGSVTAAVGAIYSRTDGGAGTSFYVKEAGTGNTGWVAK